jgi:catechol 2,3-dioxygenase-like lactoylglutathione lyase family enzyme
MKEVMMKREDFPAPAEGVVATVLLIVADIDRARDFYRDVLGAKVVLERDPAILKFFNTWLIINVGGGPTEDKPGVTLTPPRDRNTASSALNLRVADIESIYQTWTARGAQFLTPPVHYQREIRAYLRDPDGHLIEVGQSTGSLEMLEE